MAYSSKELGVLYEKLLPFFADLVNWTKSKFDWLRLFLTTFEIFKDGIFFNIVVNTNVLGPLKSFTVVCGVVVDLPLGLFVDNLMLEGKLWSLSIWILNHTYSF